MSNAELRGIDFQNFGEDLVESDLHIGLVSWNGVRSNSMSV